MDPFSWINNFKPFIFWLRAIGLWPNSASYELNIYTFYSLICIILFVFLHTFFQIMEMFMVKLDLNALAASLMIAGHIMAVVKICVFFKNLPIIKRLVSSIEYPEFKPKNEIQVELAENNFKRWMILYRVFQTGVSVAVTSWVILPILDGSYKRHDLPFFAWYPIDTVKTLYYQIVYLHQIVGFFYATAAQISLDVLSVAFTIFIGVQCELLCDNLRQAKDIIDLVSCVELHNQILIFFTDFNSFFGNIILIQMFASVAIMALLLFQLSMAVPGSSEFYTLVAISASLPLEIFMYCWYGSEVELKSSRIAHAIFESEWVGASPEFQKLILIFGLRVQQPMILTAFNLFTLSLRSFVTIMRTAWSYFALLHQLNNS